MVEGNYLRDITNINATVDLETWFSKPTFRYNLNKQLSKVWFSNPLELRIDLEYVFGNWIELKLKNLFRDKWENRLITTKKKGLSKLIVLSPGFTIG